jgi:SAM-dependent methyltransferase
MDTSEKTPQRYWEFFWRGAAPPRPVRPRARGVNHFVERAFHRAFARHFAGRAGNAFRLLEAGCAQSAWLPYFAREYGFAVTGIDYSPTGCERARQALAAEGVAGDIVLGDFLEPPPALLGAFDAAVSFGVVEHFDDTAEVLRALARFLRPGGVLIATVPNMAGLVGRLQRTIDRATFELHRALTPDAFGAAATAAGLVEVSCRPFLLFNLGAVDIARLRPHPLLHGACRLAFAGSRRAVWALQSLAGEDATHRWLSPYLWCSGALPAAGVAAYTGKRQ